MIGRMPVTRWVTGTPCGLGTNDWSDRRRVAAPGRVEPSGVCLRAAGVRQVADLRVRTAASSDYGDVEPIAEVIYLLRLELVGAQFAQPAALEDGVGEPLVHLPRHVPDSVPALARTVDRPRPGLACRVVGGRTDVVVQSQGLERCTGQVSQHQRLAPAPAAPELPAQLRQLRGRERHRWPPAHGPREQRLR